MDNKIGKFIASLRKEKGLTQQELGDKLFVTDKAVSKWERGLSFPDIGLLEKLADELDVDVSEIIYAQKGKKEEIDISKEVQKALDKIEEENNKKRRQQIIKFTRYIVCFVSIIVLSVILFIIRNNYYYPSKIKIGDNHYELGNFGKYDLQKNGLDEFIKIIEKTENQNKYNTNISYINFYLDKHANIENAKISINYFDDNYKYVGLGQYVYENKKLNYYFEGVDDCKTTLECDANNKLVIEYSKSLNAKYLTNIFKNIPFKEQIKLSNLKYYNVSLLHNATVNEKTSVFDIRDNKKVKAISFPDYNAGRGGSVDEGIYSMIVLSDGTSAIAPESYRYVFDNVDGDVKKLDFSMETDYYINAKGELLFTRDYGKTWIETDTTSSQIKETLKFYGAISLKNGSWFISKNDLIPIAYFYGENPKLRISNDNGKSWYDKEFKLFNSDFTKDITRRVVGFTNQNFGYVALGTDWSMGSGEEKKAFITNNGGVDWKKIELPENCSSKTLIDYIMYDSKTGVLFLNNSEQNEFPLMYITKNGGSNWKHVDYSGSVKNNISYVSNIDNIEKENNKYVLILSQGDSSTSKIKIESFDLEKWEYNSKFTSNIHTVG